VGCQTTVTGPVLVEGPARVVGLGAVDLHDEARVRPVGVDLVAGDVDVELRLGKGVALAQLLEPPFRLAAQEVRIRPAGSQDPAQAVPALAPG
jgi:hypothetical protein